MARLLLVSNRLPVTVKVEKDSVSVGRSPGGLATGLSRPHERSGGPWIGWPGDVSRLTDAQRTKVEAQLAELNCVPLYLSASEVSRFYEGYSNRVLWPLCHYMLDRIPRQDRDWDAYRKANERFADLAAKHYQPGDTIWVHDYQLMLVPGMLRERLPHARIGYFHHIPFPSSEIFSTLPRRTELLKGLLGADLIGFHAVSYVRHFSGMLLRQLGLDTDIDRILFQGREVRVGAFPMGIDATSFETLAQDPAVLDEVKVLHERAHDERLLLGIDRLDYTKGIPRRLLAVQRVLERSPALRGRLRFIQVAVPSRTQVQAYAEYRETVDELVGRINGQYGTVHSTPVHYLYRSLNEKQLVSLYRGADVMLVTPVRDGMNLVAKEFCAARPDEDGVLVLSEFAGAASEMRDALLINPYDVEGMADAIEEALEMPRAERQQRMRCLRAGVKARDVHWWVDSFLGRLQGLKSVEERPPLPDGMQALEKLKGPGRKVLFLDYDGTLVGFAPTPGQAAPDAELMKLLKDLCARPDLSVHLVSGRPKETLEAWFGELPLGLHAEHGLWSRMRRGQSWQALPGVSFEWKSRVKPVLDAFAGRVTGSFVEEKTASLAWHYRKVDAEFGALQARELRLLLFEQFSQEPMHILPGDRVVEVRPRGVNKGRVVPEVLKHEAPDVRVLAMGDDVTDEDLFAAIPKGGLTIHAGNKHTRAAYRTEGPQEVRRLLKALLGQ
ncbi:bifunctional alpha,alpha-trehalose-phosphate synthase (UDP-forming)/trehalose-phosphatase [Corallococcus praedator]|uniref:Bifunctional alpha,alpha-trehalose-phosphate synthase (UDP-forming)/trehalose-phosphatase n=1 Tax=Corallococcus praedator TaxID=2316724 RepID=A0ABX9QHB3_9BACT|nr:MULTISPECIES: bifunctional alpha,alpha-trehalose-phosphate synthase (UDP-forming)/trehalose-phosphatase [Corallococcus]RKH14096.1 bifunctional alpha,alpha-trehalose-phosphate synthase (UDP-forming)/trehalose-phosphatase [Corallococcus sp. CA047B]RKH33994.1 bifunctional alpha,alpha-trehalose-phosphate synthase (UDP-forming)/trehalose-phosphatase [Corallococcus sp. CA031C]RKI08072.1 bifunctional alpha,alpha-trehalose-phosphate synthase (UDP-forming)/trehalose-phosphatase [Corallococcus praedato